MAQGGVVQDTEDGLSEALLLTRVVENRANETWRNIAARLQTIKVVECERDGARIHQTIEVRPNVDEFLKTLKAPQPPRILAMAPAVSSPSTTDGGS